MIDFNTALHKLKEHHPLFHSEADFQHALAWEIHSCNSEARVRLECPMVLPNAEGDTHKKIHVDIVASDADAKIAVECKYKVTTFDDDVNGESYKLESQAAQNNGCYDFILDIMRLEALVETGQVQAGYACFLTNDPIYWEPSRNSRTYVKDQFRIHEGRLLQNTLSWEAASRRSAARTEKRVAPLVLKKCYSLSWQHYSSINGSKFCYLLVEVTAGQ